jgi:hypothetical protein
VKEPVSAEQRLDVCEGCGGDGGGEDYEGRWHECRSCDGEGYLFTDLSPMEEHDAEDIEIEASLTPTQKAWGDRWEAWADSIAEQIGV